MGLLRWIALLMMGWWLLRWLRAVGWLPLPPTQTYRSTPNARSGAPPRSPSSSTSAEEDPYQVLGLPKGASREHIKAAFQEKIRQYHPDQVAHLGPELRQLAEQRAKQITAAYNQLKSS